MIDWPGNSPDLNPIENLLALSKNMLGKLDCMARRKMSEELISNDHGKTDKNK